MIELKKFKVIKLSIAILIICLLSSCWGIKRIRRNENNKIKLNENFYLYYWHNSYPDGYESIFCDIYSVENYQFTLQNVLFPDNREFDYSNYSDCSSYLLKSFANLPSDSFQYIAVTDTIDKLKYFCRDIEYKGFDVTKFSNFLKITQLEKQALDSVYKHINLSDKFNRNNFRNTDKIIGFVAVLSQ